MKITPEHYRYMKTCIAASVNSESFLAHRMRLSEEGKAKDIEKRLRWDLSYAAKLTSFFCSTIYPYADDNHIDTALRRIVEELFSKQGAAP